jgi:hypothetical protein
MSSSKKKPIEPRTGPTITTITPEQFIKGDVFITSWGERKLGRRMFRGWPLRSK